MYIKIETRHFPKLGKLFNICVGSWPVTNLGKGRSPSSKIHLAHKRWHSVMKINVVVVLTGKSDDPETTHATFVDMEGHSIVLILSSPDTQNVGYTLATIVFAIPYHVFPNRHFCYISMLCILKCCCCIPEIILRMIVPWSFTCDRYILPW